MNTPLSTAVSAELLQHWRRQIGGRRRWRRAQGPRPLGAMSYLTSRPAVNSLVDIRRLVLVVLHDQARDDDAPAIRVAGYSGASVPWGAQWGGPAQNRFAKDLSLPPSLQAQGARFDLAAKGSLALALQLDRQLERRRRYPHFPKRRLRLPQLWAAFLPADAVSLGGVGAEFEAACRQTGLRPAELLASVGRSHQGLRLFPIEYVSHAWAKFVCVLADLRGFPKRQVFVVEHPAADLCGYDGAVEFDFFHSRFGTPSSRPSQRRRRRRRAASVVA